MCDSEFRRKQFEDRYLPHVREINTLVDRMRRSGPGSAPYVAPSHGGSAGGILSLMLNPGNGKTGGASSGFLSLDNNDDASREQLKDLRNTGIDQFSITPWNVSPWYSNTGVSEESLMRGAATVAQIISLMPALRVVLIQGTEALRAWEEYVIPLHSADLLGGSARFSVISTYSSGPGALGRCSSSERRRRQLDRRAAFEQAADLLRAAPIPWTPPRLARR